MSRSISFGANIYLEILLHSTQFRLVELFKDLTKHYSNLIVLYIQIRTNNLFKY